MLQLAATRYGNDNKIRSWNIGMLQLGDAHRECSMLYTVAWGASHAIQGSVSRFKVYADYKLKLKAYSKRSFYPFRRWERINMQYDDENCIETTIGQHQLATAIIFYDRWHTHIWKKIPLGLRMRLCILRTVHGC